MGWESHASLLERIGKNPVSFTNRASIAPVGTDEYNNQVFI